MALLRRRRGKIKFNLARPILVLGLTAVLGYLLGFSHGYALKGSLWPGGSPSQIGLAQQEDFQLFWTVADIIGQKYYGNFDLGNLVYGSVQGLVAALSDPYSSFDLPDTSKQFFQELAGNYEGIGVEVEYRDETLVVIAPVKGSPAYEAGVRPGDIILAIDGKDTSSMDLVEALAKIRGPQGSKVKLLIQRNGQNIIFEITRTLVHIKSVTTKEEDGVFIISISKFAEDTDKLFNQAVSDILKQNPSGVILDLRHNPGGLLDSAVEVANEFLPAGKTIVEERFRGGQKTIFTSDGSGRLTDIKLVVLINGGTASAGEIVAGALGDNGRATLVGERSFGKGSVQEVDEFADGSTLRLTIAEWFTPEGTSLKIGLKPDIELSDREEEDIILSKAKELLKK